MDSKLPSKDEFLQSTRCSEAQSQQLNELCNRDNNKPSNFFKCSFCAFARFSNSFSFSFMLSFFNNLLKSDNAESTACGFFFPSDSNKRDLAWSYFAT